MNEENELITMYDEEGKEREINILFEMEINNNKYLIYSLASNDNIENIYASKIVIINNEEQLIDLENEEEKQLVMNAVYQSMNSINNQNV